jgi:hypothetical protein
MRRIKMSVMAMAVMAMMLVAMAAPAFADRGGGGHTSFDPETGEFTRSGGGADETGPGGAGGHFTANLNDPAVPFTTAGGFGAKGGGGGGRCEGTVFPTFSEECKGNL